MVRRRRAGTMEKAAPPARGRGAPDPHHASAMPAESLSSLLGLHDDAEGAAQLAQDPRWRLRGWCAEFADAQTEAGYARYSEQFVARQLQWTLGAWALFLLLFAVSDFLALGWTAGFQILLTMRVAVVACVLLLMRAVARQPRLATRGFWTTVLECVGFASFMLLYVLRPDITFWIYATTLMLIVMLLVLVPNRLCQALGVAVFGALLTAAMLARTDWPPQELMRLGLVLVLPLGMGYVSAWRVHMLQRQQYALLMAARRSNARLRDEAAQRAVLQEALQIQATTDPLTGLANRREYEKRFLHEMARARREGGTLSLAILDLDFFKRVNDQYGHAAGDEVLRHVARLCREEFRAVDIAGRLGGEEFVVLMPGTALHSAGDVVLRFLRVLEQTDIGFEGLTLRVRATAGVAELLPREEQLDALLQRADAALYAGKQSGRNRVMLAQPGGAVLHWTGEAATAAD